MPKPATTATAERNPPPDGAAARRVPAWVAPVLLLLLGLALRVGMGWQHHRFLLAEFLWTDDSFISLSVARNLAHGLGMTSDGVHPTNGFQPLYVFLMVPVYALVPEDDLTTPLYVATIMLALAGIGAAALFYMTALRLFTRTAALCVLFFFMVSSYFVTMEINGLETAIYGLTLAAAVYYYVSRFVTGPAPTARNGVILGILLGLSVLARVDAGILVVAVGFDYLWRNRRRAAAAISGLARIAAGCAVPVLPWLLTCAIVCGSIFPISGQAVRFASVRLGWRMVGNYVGYTGPKSFTPESIPWQYYPNNLLHLTALTVSLLPMTAHSQGLGPSYVILKSIRFPFGQWLAKLPWLTLSAVLAFGAVMLIGPFLWRRRAFARDPRAAPLIFVRLAITGWICAYAFYGFGPWHSSRYIYPALALLTFSSGRILDAFVRVTGARLVRMRRVALGVGAVAYAFVFFNQSSHYYTTRFGHFEPDRYTPVLPWLEANLPPDAKLGAFQSGILSYFTGKTCINLDGVVNASALKALREERMWDYIHEKEIEYIVEWPILLERFIEYPDERPHALTPVSDAEEMWVYRVEQSIESSSELAQADPPRGPRP